MKKLFVIMVILLSSTMCFGQKKESYLEYCRRTIPTKKYQDSIKLAEQLQKDLRTDTLLMVLKEKGYEVSLDDATTDYWLRKEKRDDKIYIEKQQDIIYERWKKRIDELNISKEKYGKQNTNIEKYF